MKASLVACLCAAERHALHVQHLVHAVAVADSMTFGERDPEKGKSRSIATIPAPAPNSPISRRGVA